MSRRSDPNVISDKERIALKEFKQRIPDLIANFKEYWKHDVWLVQWLRARDLDVRKAELMIRKYLDFRKERLEGILEWKVPELLDQHYPVKMSGFDKDGCIVIIAPFGKWDFRRICSLKMGSDLLLYTAQLFEQGYTFLASKSTKDYLYTQIVFILDFEGFSFTQITSRETIELLISLLHTFEDNHPEVLKDAFIINGPKIFEILFSIIKPLLTMRTLAKVRIFGSNTKQWRSALLENIEPDQLPSQYGGSITTCKDYKAIYGLDWLHQLGNNYKVFPENEMNPVTVEAGMKHFVKFKLISGSKLSWNFKTKDYDIGFSAYYSTEIEARAMDAEETETELCPLAIVDSHLHLQKGAIVAEKSGTYTLVFDNSFSRFRKKDLFYVARVDFPSTSTGL